MPRFFFNIDDGTSLIDHQGTELPDLAAVRREAVHTSAKMLKDSADYWDGTEWRMEVLNEGRELVLRLNFTATAHPAV
jgi:hypothetical protein